MRIWAVIGIVIGLLLLFWSQENLTLTSPCVSEAACRSGTPLTFPLLWSGALIPLIFRVPARGLFRRHLTP